MRRPTSPPAALSDRPRTRLPGSSPVPSPGAAHSCTRHPPAPSPGSARPCTRRWLGAVRRSRESSPGGRRSSVEDLALTDGSAPRSWDWEELARPTAQLRGGPLPRVLVPGGAWPRWRHGRGLAVATPAALPVLILPAPFFSFPASLLPSSGEGSRSGQKKGGRDRGALDSAR
jgi:hypothetical protein